MLSHKSPLSQLCSELLLEVCDELGHHCVDLLVVEGLGLVLQNEVDGVALLALGQVLALRTRRRAPRSSGASSLFA